MSINKDAIKKVLLGYQPKAEVFPDDLNSFEIFGSLANGMAAYPGIPEEKWDKYDFSNGQQPIENPTFLDNEGHTRYEAEIAVYGDKDTIESHLKQCLVEVTGAEYGDPSLVTKVSSIRTTANTTTIQIIGDDFDAVSHVYNAMEACFNTPDPATPKENISVTINMEVFDESLFRKAARKRAIDDGLDEDSADAYLDPDIMSLDECGIMLIDPGTSPAGATIV